MEERVERIKPCCQQQQMYKFLYINFGWETLQIDANDASNRVEGGLCTKIIIRIKHT